MSNIDPTYDPDQDAALAALAAERDQERQAHAQLQREMAFLRAGVDTTTAQGGIFMRGYEGEATTEAIQAAAKTLGLGQPEPPADPAPATPPNPELQPGEANLTNERHEVSGGASQEQGITPDPYAEALTLGTDIIKGGGKIEAGIGSALNFLAGQAQEGNQRVIVDRRSLQGSDSQ